MAKIHYIKNFTDNRKNPETTTHDDLDRWSADDFMNEGMCEMLQDQKVRHLYFDFDDMKNEEELKEVVSWLEGLTNVFGRVCYAGYTTNQHVRDTHLGFIKNTKSFKYHTISVHAVFPDTCIDNDEMYEIMTSGDYEINRFVDKKVYKATGKNQLLRHPYAPKNDRPVGFAYDELNLPKPSDLVATCRGSERKVEHDEWIKAFPKILVSDDSVIDKLVRNEVDASKKRKTDVDDELVAIDDAITKSEMTKELFEALYKGFEGLTIHGDATKTEEEISLFPLFSALYACGADDDDVQDALEFIKDNAELTPNANAKWSEKRKQARKNDKCSGPGALFNYLKNFNPEYYKLHVVPLLPKKKVEAKFDLKDSFSISDIRNNFGRYQMRSSTEGVDNDPERLDYNAVLTDLRRIMIIVDTDDGLYVFKERDAKNKKMTLKFANRTTAFNRLKDLKVGTEVKETKTEKKLITKTAFDVIDASNNNSSFYKNSVCFFSDDPLDFSFFQGYKYESVQNDSLIEKFNEHIKNVWCKGDENLYEYVQSWFATVIQHPLARTRTALVVKGTEGTGKNTVTDVWSELLAGYSNSNVSDLDSIIGKFNSRVENKKLLVMNEMDSAEMSTAAVFNRLKKLITEDSIDINEKNLKVRDGVQNVSNLVILSNEFNPVKVSTTDRRYCIITPSDEHVQDEEYFDDLYASMKVRNEYRKDFMNALMYFYMNYDVKINLSHIPDTFEREILKQANKSAIESFIERYCVELSGDGIAPKECFDMFKKFIVENNFKSNYKLNSFKAEMSKYCEFDEDNQLHRYKGVRVYRFTEVTIKKYKNFIENMKKEDECVEITEEYI